MNLDPRTGRPFGDHGSHADALNFALDAPACVDVEEFLRAWREGSLDEWPEFYEWLAKRSPVQAEPDKPGGGLPPVVLGSIAALGLFVALAF